VVLSKVGISLAYTVQIRPPFFELDADLRLVYTPDWSLLPHLIAFVDFI
jgi:hypothetical protein